MRDTRFIVKHRGGFLKKEQHRQLMSWGCECVQHVLLLFGTEINQRLLIAIKIANELTEGKATVGEARNTSLSAIAVTNEQTDPVSFTVARAVAIAHMADHSLKAALYALKAIHKTGKSVDLERNWQNEQLPKGNEELVLTARAVKANGQKNEFFN